MQVGTVARIRKDTGYGFITPNEIGRVASFPKDVFFSVQGVVNELDFYTLNEGDLIAYEVVKGPRGPYAIFVQRGSDSFSPADWVAHYYEVDNAIARSTTRTLIEGVKELSPDLIQHLKQYNEDLDKVEPEVFEHLVAELMASQGWNDVRLVGRNSETSADIFAMHYIPNADGIPVRYFVEVKRTKERIGVEVFNQVLGAMISERDMHGWHGAIIVTLSGVRETRKFTSDDYCRKGIAIREKSDLISWLDGYKPNSNGLWVPPDFGSKIP